MKTVKVTCDKCKKEISSLGYIHVQISHTLNSNPMYNLDLCTNCYNSLDKVIGDWLKEEMK